MTWDDLDNLSDVEEIMAETLFKKLVEASEMPFGTAASYLASCSNEGERIGRRDTVAPYQVIYRAPDAIKSKFSNERPQGTWYDPIHQALNQGDTIYDVYAYRPETEW